MVGNLERDEKKIGKSVGGGGVERERHVEADMCIDK